MGSSKNQSALQSEQKSASKMSLPNPSASKLASFSVKKPVKLLKFENGGFEFEQGGVKFGAGLFESQKNLALQFDPSKPFDVVAGAGGFGGNNETPAVRQGKLIFNIPNPVALTDPTDPAQISPNGAALTPQTPLARVPRNVATGALAGTAASRALSGAAYKKSRPVGLQVPLLAGY